MSGRASAPQSSKYCPRCRTSKTLADFYGRRRHTAPVCTDCYNERRKSYRESTDEGNLDLSPEAQQNSYLIIIAKMYEQGIASKEFCLEALERVTR